MTEDHVAPSTSPPDRSGAARAYASHRPGVPQRTAGFRTAALARVPAPVVPGPGASRVSGFAGPALSGDRHAAFEGDARLLLGTHAAPGPLTGESGFTVRLARRPGALA
ncbi:hypothetical protein [Streptomyces sp. NPDC060198]|uniref:hypothetical protein n=1 Tax=Streptomyces sp. NPDC060198 TaxID=3347070 RepID=UPI003667FCD3